MSVHDTFLPLGSSPTCDIAPTDAVRSAPRPIAYLPPEIISIKPNPLLLDDGLNPDNKVILTVTGRQFGDPLVDSDPAIPASLRNVSIRLAGVLCNNVQRGPVVGGVSTLTCEVDSFHTKTVGPKVVGYGPQCY